MGYLSLATTRRLAAILAADVAGYSRLMGADEEGTHARLRAHFAELVHAKIEEHRGRVVKKHRRWFLGGRDRLYHRFLERTIAHVAISNCCSEVTPLTKLSSYAPTRPDERYEKAQASIAPSAPASAGGEPCGVGGPGEGPGSYRARGGR